MDGRALVLSADFISCRRMVFCWLPENLASPGGKEAYIFIKFLSRPFPSGYLLVIQLWWVWWDKIILNHYYSNQPICWETSFELITWFPRVTTPSLFPPRRIFCITRCLKVRLLTKMKDRPSATSLSFDIEIT